MYKSSYATPHATQVSSSLQHPDTFPFPTKLAMFSTRFITFILFLVAFGTLVCASPIAVGEVAKREATTVAKRATVDDVIAIFKTLQSTVAPEIATLKSLAVGATVTVTVDPGVAVNNIITALGVAVHALLALGPIVGLTTVLLGTVAALIAEILSDIVAALAPLVGTTVSLLALVPILDLAINLVLITVGSLLGTVLTLVAGLIADVPLWTTLGLATSILTLHL